LSRYFKYKRPDDLLDDARRLGLDIRLSDDLGPLLRPGRVGPRAVGNRLAIQPMEGCDAEPDGSPDALTFRRYERFGAGGAKLVWGEAAAVVPEGRANPRQLVCDAGHLDGLARLLEACRRAHRDAWGDDGDLLVGLQLTHSGRYSHPRPILAQHDPLLDGLTFVDRKAGTRVGPDDPLISDDELDRLQDRYVEAAGVALRAGFDFVDLKQCHKYLLNELLGSRGRPGRYGGPFENRTRFVREVAGRIRAEHPGLIVATRLNVFDGLPYRVGAGGVGEPCGFETPVRSCWGTSEDDPHAPDLAEPIALVGQLRDLGVELVNVTLGNPYASPHLLRPFEYPPPDGYETPEHPLIGVDRHQRLTEAIARAHPGLAVVGSGYSWLQAWMLPSGAANVRDGRVGFVGVGRGSLSHPDFGRFAAEGRPLDPRRTCRTFSYCTALMRAKHNSLGQFPTGCPPFDKEAYGPIWRDAQGTEPRPG
jgi:2,4-dienoyl-CoA reductase-like NADH-dependent reductase (Old Yellow Enzyme family)